MPKPELHSGCSLCNVVEGGGGRGETVTRERTAQARESCHWTDGTVTRLERSRQVEELSRKQNRLGNLSECGLASNGLWIVSCLLIVFCQNILTIPTELGSGGTHPVA